MAIVGNHAVVRKNAGTFAAAGINVVPNGSVLVDFVQAVVVSSATGGNRLLALEVFDGTNVIYRSTMGPTQAASLTRRYTWLSGVVRDTTFAGGSDEAVAPLPVALRLYPGQTLRVVDRTAVDGAGDTVAPTYAYFTD